MGPVLGEAEWKDYGGNIIVRSYPNGRKTVIYVAPDGSKLRSWKTCLAYMEESPKSETNGTSTKSLPTKKDQKPSKTEKVNGESGHVSASDHEDGERKSVAVDFASELRKASNSSKSSPKEVAAIACEGADGSVKDLCKMKKQKVKAETLSESSSGVSSEDSKGASMRSRKRVGDSFGESAECKKARTTDCPPGLASKDNPADSSGRCEADTEEEITPQYSSRRPKRAAAGTNFKEKRIRLGERDARIDAKKERYAEDQTTMLMMTRSESDGSEVQQRTVLDFYLHDGHGRLRPVDPMENGTYLSGLCISKDGALDKDKGVRCDSLGPVHSWSIMGYDEDRVEIVLSTSMADYYLDRPAACYRKIYGPLFDSARVCREVYRALSLPDGGDPSMGLPDLELRLIRLYNNMGTSGQFFSRDYLSDIGEFVATQLYALDADAPDGSQLFSGLGCLEELKHLSANRRQRRLGGEDLHAGAPLAENETADGSPLGDDYKLARRLQNVMDLASNRPARRTPAAKGKFYVKINENEIANDYPEPEYYKSDEPETDEYVMFAEDVHPDDEDFPHRFLDNWTLYNSEMRLVSLELLPMLPCAENDMQIFGSGVISEDDGSGYYHEEDGGGRSIQDEERGGFRVFLSAVKEWKVEWGSGMLIISFRTEVSWYRLGTPSRQYADWYKPVQKTAKIAVKIITMLKDENRVSRLSFNDVIKKLTEQARTEPTWIASKQADVERYVIVHGQIILQQFAEFPDQLIQKSGFILGLATKMEQKSHEKLAVSKRRLLLQKEVNLNPRAIIQPQSSDVVKKEKKAPMRATTTQLVNRIWSNYFGSDASDACPPCEDESNAKDSEIVAVDVVDGDDSDDEVVEVISPPVGLSPQKCTRPKSTRNSSTKQQLWKSSSSKVKWGDESSHETREGCPVYKKALFSGLELKAGDAVSISGESASRRFLIEYLYDSDDGPMIHGRMLVKGEETILGDAANERELFLTDACSEIRVAQVKDFTQVEIRKRNWGHQFRKENATKDEEDRKMAKERKRRGLPQEYFCRSWWSPENGAFFSVSSDALGVGSGICSACQAREDCEKKMEVEIYPEGRGFRWQGVEYRINDYMYLDPEALKLSKPSSKPSENTTHKGGRNKGLHAFIICQLLSVTLPPTANSKTKSCSMCVRRFYRPEDVDNMKAYKSQLHEVYYSEDTYTVDISNIRGKCEVRRNVHNLDTSKGVFDHVFVCDYVHDPKTQTIKHLPANIKLGSSDKKVDTTSLRTTRAKGKGKARVDDEVQEQQNLEEEKSPPLATLDIFAGCGGLSEGLHQSGVSETKWAIEYDREAAEAFKLNHPSSEVFCDNCNVVLRAIMERGGDLDDCVSTPEADDLCSKMEEIKKSKLPIPGEVDFVNGGPPCQGFSGMNRFSQRVWSKVQCEMILAFLSYADYFRPRYFLLENVRNFVSFNKGQTFRLTMASLLEMGYQVRFGVLQAGNFGVSQSRKRAFIWAAAPDEALPNWPEARHVFASSQLGITLPGGGQYAAVRDAGLGAPFRAITVRDTIADLPAVANGADTQKTVYTEPAQSWFQMHTRGKTDVLTDHISKEMNELNLIRCQRIPKRPGADWRDLPAEKIKLSTGQLVDLIPWCLPNTAARHNQWKGLFGRLDWDGNFPTSITDPQPMGKVGMCFHPVQNRIVTVRECARSQGFPDSYKFAGNIICKHRQIGNAVPPPLACALGYRLKEALNSKRGSTGC
ncbi:DNA (cytosine-5)-methyltransferase 1 [Marchantia polymorpha subsp. ruderalis]|uniref:DNA (cytosine-5)-methyltransferase n=2 Tax=Marchantia polymorpha TaxID=3197 RepID=A0AAF6BTA4_MARPO|nr:hypothetical protein MARPO_0038s0027 [Marchantia polymorpha]BBN15236.1 hypothetical protein Mp_6g18180 [Marchantia polymorpha subsp. ruderalis]PTQ40669.1 hypothetical protein MARPO_0038s0027 [Marchantia polymorpha]PTQ40670.1 hypothetical protein MARPO_0038s0027 [Marchantia polymorpha]BBN15237.1 hypothetical protein Mp_6g18180 [Marchantia polymorpha subsp. ruderalis]|eukprot:PTQ40668.1 hypothetical protein MARPO_0038s0027 [Marchantia polymorpha]